VSPEFAENVAGRAPVTDPGRFSDDVLAKARKDWEAGNVEPDKDFDTIWWVQGRDITRPPYRVQVLQREGRIEWITCTCPHGLNTNPGETKCHHVAAVLLAIEIGEST